MGNPAFTTWNLSDKWENSMLCIKIQSSFKPPLTYAPNDFMILAVAILLPHRDQACKHYTYRGLPVLESCTYTHLTTPKNAYSLPASTEDVTRLNAMIPVTNREMVLLWTLPQNYTVTMPQAGVSPKQQGTPGLTLHFHGSLDKDCTTSYKCL